MSASRLPVKALSSPRDSSVSRKLDAVGGGGGVSSSSAADEEEEEGTADEKKKDERVSLRLARACARAVRRLRGMRAVAR